MKVLAVAMLGVLAVLVVVAAWVAIPRSPSPSPAVAAADPTSPLATAPPSPSSAAPTPAETESSAPTSPAIDLGGIWIMPAADTRLTSYATTLSARPTGSGDGVTTFTKVVFSGTWAGADKTVMCKATRPAESGDWQCRADLLALGVPPGKVSFSFDVYGEGVPAARSPDGPRRVTYAVPPPKPTDPRWKHLRELATQTEATAEIYRLRWSAPSSYADDFLIYNTWECPRESRKNAGTPCFVPGTPVDASQLDLLKRAPGRARSVELRLSGSECGPTYGTILMRARNAFGVSGFTIVDAALVPDPRDIVC